MEVRAGKERSLWEVRHNAARWDTMLAGSSLLFARRAEIHVTRNGWDLPRKAAIWRPFGYTGVFWGSHSSIGGPVR